jgi:hypothetical protein
MMTCGMYNGAGNWMVDVGIPAKSGVGGGIFGVVPGVCGVAVFSPALNSSFNSVRGIEACVQLSQRLGLHVLQKKKVKVTFYEVISGQRKPIKASSTNVDKSFRDKSKGVSKDKSIMRSSSFSSSNVGSTSNDSPKRAPSNKVADIPRPGGPSEAELKVVDATETGWGTPEDTETADTLLAAIDREISQRK